MKKAWLMIGISLFARMLVAQEIDPKAFEGRHWYGAYMGESKVGYLFSEIAVEGDGSVRVAEQSQFHLKMGNIEQDLRMDSLRLYHPDGALRRIEFEALDMGGETTFIAEVRGDELRVTKIVGGQEETEVLPKPEESLSDVLKAPHMVKRGPEVGDSVSYSLFEPPHMREIHGTSTVTDITERTFEGAPTKVYEVTSQLEITEGTKLKSMAYVSETGVTLEDRVMGMLVIKLEPEEVAKSLETRGEVMVSNRATIGAPVENPRSRSEVRLLLQGPFTEDHALDDGRQTMRLTEDGLAFIGRKRADMPTAALPIDEAGLEKWLEPTTFIQSDAPAIQEKAREVVGDETDARKAAETLVRWVYDNMTRTYSARLSNSLEVLSSMEGDCTEHSVLFVGLARAAGLPAREVAGLVYVGGKDYGFYFHQWAKVWLGEWVQVDPTFDQFAVDATHIKLVEGDLYEQLRLLPVIGSTTVELLNESAAADLPATEAEAAS